MPVSSTSKCLTISPLLLIIAVIPLLADRTKKELFSIALKIAFEKCWCGPIDLPNHASSDKFTIKFVVLISCINSGNIIS